jgi:hypothetical protein
MRVKKRRTTSKSSLDDGNIAEYCFMNTWKMNLFHPTVILAAMKVTVIMKLMSVLYHMVLPHSTALSLYLSLQM